VEPDDSFDLAAAGLRSDGAELAASLAMLAGKLEQALPHQAVVERRGGGVLGRGPKQVRNIKVQLGDCCYRLELSRAGLEGSRERTSGGIAIKREPLDPDAWVAALTADLRDQAERSAEARMALERLLA
jgi:hypothetical protein